MAEQKQRLGLLCSGGQQGLAEDEKCLRNTEQQDAISHAVDPGQVQIQPGKVGQLQAAEGGQQQQAHDSGEGLAGVVGGAKVAQRQHQSAEQGKADKQQCE